MFRLHLRPVRAACATALCLALGLAQAASEGVATGTGLRLSGFGTLGWVGNDAADSHTFRSGRTQGTDSTREWRADVDTRLGLQANLRTSQQWEFVVQGLLRSRLPETPAADSLQWAFASYEPRPDLRLRAGRLSPDLYLLADYRHVGFAYPWVRPMPEFYGWIPEVLDGVDLRHGWMQGAGRWQLTVFAGRMHETMAFARGQGSIHVDFDHVLGATLQHEHGPWLLKGTLSRASARSSGGDAPMSTIAAGLDGIGQLPVAAVAAEARQLRGRLPSADKGTYGALGLVWTQGAWQWQSEFAMVQSESHAVDGHSAYTGLAWRHGDATLFGVLSHVRPRHGAVGTPDWTAALAPVLGAAQAAQAQALGTGAMYAINMSRIEQNTLSAGLRWDLDDRVALKLQWDRVRVARAGAGLWGATSLEPQQVNLVSAALDFIF
ncbi:hypothetical protein [Caldimonas tepidiphila]|uniref:hypothetical protein n=1 Tax=Caldimonas tepidiphila TaxID=2315841 RepID=UPI000E5BEDB6|nr:hypothetical protein [Caldimonas tepidiphila]